MTKNYILKPGLHQFTPTGPAIHSNATLTDEQAAWYLQRYPHIAPLFVQIPNGDNASQKQRREQAKKQEGI